jgi:hypothetical protein
MTTTVTKTLGIDYADFNAFAAALPASLVTADQQWILQVPNTSEFSFTTAQTISGKTCDATRNVIIRPSSGQGFADNAGVLTNPYFYDATKGAAVTTNLQSADCFSFLLDYMEIRGIQWKVSPTSGSFIGLKCVGTSQIVEGNIVSYLSSGSQPPLQVGDNGKDNSVARSNLVYAPQSTGGVIDLSYSANTQVIGNTVIAAVGNNGIAAQFTSGVCKNNAIFGPATPIHSNLTTNATKNATNAATINGSSSLTSLTQSAQFFGASDFRLKSGNSLAGAGVAVTGWTVDALKQTLSSPPQIGAPGVVAGSTLTTAISWTEGADVTALAVTVGSGSVTATAAWTEGADVVAITGTASPVLGTITTPVLKNNTGTILASETGVVVNVYNASTGALVVRKTGQASSAGGVVTVTDALIVTGISYAYEVVLASNGRRLPLATAT